MRLVIKLGGTLLDDARATEEIAGQMAGVARRHELIVVHGGGKQVTRFLKERGIATRFVDGLRVSDDAVIDAVSKIIAGSVNKRLVSAITAAGHPAVGLSGVDGPLTLAEPLNSALGFVGKPVRTDKLLLELLANAGFLPVVACIAGDRRGNIYNVNADQMAVSCALAWRAEQLLFLTDVAGVSDGSGQVMPRVAAETIQGLIDCGIAQGGMQAKLMAAASALAAGIGEVIIAPGDQPGICERILAGEAVGTRLEAPVLSHPAAKA
jgi:acetylglutamate kinase